MKLLCVLVQLQQQYTAQTLFLVYVPTRWEPVMFSKPHHCNLDRYTYKHTRVQAAHVYIQSSSGVSFHLITAVKESIWRQREYE